MCDDHHFKDEYLFYRFRNDEAERQKFSDVLGVLKHMSPSARRNMKSKSILPGSPLPQTITSSSSYRRDVPISEEQESIPSGETQSGDEGYYTPMSAIPSGRTPMPVPSPSEGMLAY